MLIKTNNLSVDYNINILHLCQSESAKDQNVCILGSHCTKTDKSVLLKFNLQRQETVVAEVKFRHHCAIACLNGEHIIVYDKYYYYVVLRSTFPIIAIHFTLYFTNQSGLW